MIKVTLEFSTPAAAADFLASYGEPDTPTTRETAPAEPKRGRGRPRKEAAAAPAPAPAPAEPAPAEPAPAEPAPAEPEQPLVAGDVPEARTVTKEELVNKASEVLQKLGSAKFREVLGSYKITRLGELAEGSWVAFYDELVGLLGGAEPAKDDGADLL